MSKEKFREYNYNSKPFKVSFNNKTKVWIKDKPKWIKQIQAMVDNYFTKQKIIMGNRGYHYEHVTSKIYSNFDELDAQLNRVLTDLRLFGLIDWSAINDDSRLSVMPPEWDNPQEFMESAISQYRLPRWSDQEYYVEVFCEKEGLEPIIGEVCKEWHVRVGYSKGFGSTDFVQTMARQRFRSAILEGKKARLLYLGDFDSSGLEMIEDIRKRVIEFLANGSINAYGDGLDRYYINDNAYKNCNENCGACKYLDECKMTIVQYPQSDLFQIVPLALTEEQIKYYKFLSDAIKVSDSRSKKHIEKYGKICCEINALHPQDLKQILTEGIKYYLDDKKYQRWIRKEKKDKQTLEVIGDMFKKGED